MMNTNEIQVAVPWGYIAAKTWGESTDPVVLTFHGIFDNAGSFNRLIPHLPKPFYYVCCDLPGHGQSSHFPPSQPYYTLTNLVAYKALVNYFKRDKYTILGHSYGGQIGLLFAQIYPERVEKLIMLDTIHLNPITADEFKPAILDQIENFLILNDKISKGQPPQYTYQKALDRLMNQRSMGHLIPEAAEALLQRGLKSVGDGKYIFSLDQRLKTFLDPVHDIRYIIDTFRTAPVTCPVLIVLGRENEIQQIAMKPLLEVMQQKSNISIKYVDGDHDVHNNKPELVAPYVSKFLLMKKNKL